MAYKPTTEQAEALAAFAARHGRLWRQRLRWAWMAGGYDSHFGEWIDGPCQQIRNDPARPSGWLNRYKPQKPMTGETRDR